MKKVSELIKRFLSWLGKGSVYDEEDCFYCPESYPYWTDGKDGGKIKTGDCCDRAIKH